MTNCGTDKKYFKKLLLIDLDGVLNLYNGKYDANKISKIRPRTLDFIKKLHQDYRISIFTARDIKTTIEWLKENDLNNYIEEVTNIKNPFASVILDDRAINFDGDYNKAYNSIKNFQPYWKKLKIK